MGTHWCILLGIHAGRHIQLDAHVCVRLGPCVIGRGGWWECGVAGTMDSFLNRVPPQPCVVNMGWGRPRLLLSPCLLPHVGQDVVLDVADRGPVVPAHDGYTVWPHQELLKVPADIMDLHGFPEEAVR